MWVEKWNSKNEKSFEVQNRMFRQQGRKSCRKIYRNWKKYTLKKKLYIHLDICASHDVFRHTCIKDSGTAVCLRLQQWRAGHSAGFPVVAFGMWEKTKNWFYKKKLKEIHCRAFPSLFSFYCQDTMLTLKTTPTIKTHRLSRNLYASWNILSRLREQKINRQNYYYYFHYCIIIFVYIQCKFLIECLHF